jgi:hypothetical protein
MEDERPFKCAFDIKLLKRSLLSAAQDAKYIEKRNNTLFSCGFETGTPFIDFILRSSRVVVQRF